MYNKKVMQKNKIKIDKKDILKAREKLHHAGISRRELAERLKVNIGAVHCVLGCRPDVRAVRGDARRVAVYLGLRPEDKFATLPPVPQAESATAKNS